MSIDKCVHVFQKTKDLAVLFQEVDNRPVASGQLLVLFVFPRIMHGAAVEHIPASVSRRIFGNSFLIRKTHYAYGEFPSVAYAGKLRKFGQLA